MNRISKQRRRLQIYSIDETTLDSGGNPTRQNILRGTRCGAISYLTGKEYFEGNQVHGEATHKIEIGYDSLTKLITPKWHIIDVEESVTFEITACDNFGCRREITLWAKRVY